MAKKETAKKEDSTSHNVAVAVIALRASSLIIAVFGLNIFAKNVFYFLYNFQYYTETTGAMVNLTIATLESMVYLGAAAFIWCKAKCIAAFVVKDLD